MIVHYKEAARYDDLIKSPLGTRNRRKSSAYRCWSCKRMASCLGAVAPAFLCVYLLGNQEVLVQSLPWHTVDSIDQRNSNSKPSFLSRLSTRVTFEWNGTITDKDLQSNMDCQEDKDLGLEDDQPESYGSMYTRRKNSTFVNSLTEQIRTMTSGKTWMKRNTAATRIDKEVEETKGDHTKTGLYRNRRSIGINNRWLMASTRNSTLASALADHIRSVPSIKDFLQRNLENSTGSFDWVGAVSTSANRSEPSAWRGGDTPDLPAMEILRTSSPATGLDRIAQGFCLILARLVAAQCLATWVRSRETNWIQQLADKLLSEESAVAVKTIRTMLSNMEDHGIVDLFSKYSSQDIAASLYALYRLQRAAIRYEAIEEGQAGRHPQDLMHILEELSHYVVYATAAYGWKMDLAFQGRLHLGDEHALLRKTGIQKDDIIKLNLKSKAHLPVYFLVRDRQRKSLVLCIRGTWSAHDVLTDLCCTAEEYQGPVSSPLSSLSSWSTPKEGERRFCAHKGILEASMAVAIAMEDVIEEELKANPGYTLVLVGHSMGAGCCSLLATFWEHKFDLMAYLFGGPCTAPIDSRPTNNTAIINVISEGDPFRCLSLGHVADVSGAVARLCEDSNLRRMVLTRTQGHVHEMDEEDLEFCWDTMESIRKEVMTNSDKLFPPGRILHVKKQKASVSAPSKTAACEYDSDTEDEPGFDSCSSANGIVIHEVGPEVFRELVICPRMFDVSRHLPSLYEDTLRSLIEREKGTLDL